MMRVTYHFQNELDLIEEYWCDPSRSWVQRRAETLGAGCYTPEVCDDDGPVPVAVGDGRVPGGGDAHVPTDGEQVG